MSGEPSTTEREVGLEIAVRGIRRGPPRERRSLLTGALETYAELEMTDDEYRAASAIFARYGTIDEYGEGRLALPTASIEVWGFDFDGCMMNLVGDLHGACELLFELATAARLIVQFESAAGDPSALVTTAEVLEQVRALDDAAHDEIGPVILVTDVAAMWRRLARPDAQPRGVA